MKEKDSRGISLRNCLAVAIILVVLAGIGVAIYFAVDRWWSDNTVNNAPEPLEVAIAVLTVLIAFVAIYMGLMTLMSKRDLDAFEKKTQDELEKVKADWGKFEKEQKPIIEKLEKDRDELIWISKLKDKVLPTDPYLRKDESQEVIESITRHYNKDQDEGAWEMYGVGRSFDREYKYDIAIEYYIEALDKYPTDEGLKLHIYQSLGLDYFYRGKQREANGKNKEAIEDYEEAIEDYDRVIKYNPQFAEAHNNKAITLIQLGKIEGDKTKPYNDAVKCYNDAIECLGKAIEIEDNYDHYYDKARAHALLNQRDKAIKSLTRAFKLVKHEKLGDLLKHITDDLEDFRNIKEQEEFKALVKRYTDIPKGNN